ncbi:xanthine dehydrogenase [Carbonactinospora thermoautotrophica]|uniref:Carbon monoxide dehydrogenase large chain n=1 Tax=Carbonactinospora thermoautotrophica TaxID=1469144 RepID=A0A132MSH3_9ACTN|nr:aerobic carbon-monoxide dehydrogenase large subunit [Carbonactinospora thermoautotrophica]KWX00754.1 Carbon monoxide dehydrogenase large chain [Carbonactinospora thermoautotrophica]KWX05282.1 xanthine dehydrogenase [Carbonactinospora thermoautotrophica]KWX09939.1 xanthine dehydrogenase [Carbonactinospora thermoautotrophica]
MTRLFGSPIPRLEDERLVSGRGRYLDDLGRGALAAAFVRAPHAHARIVDVDVTDALDIDGLVAVYTWEDLPGKLAEPLPLLIPHPALTHPKTGYPLAREEVNHVGEPVVMVVARDRYVAEDACDRIRVTYDPLPPVVTIEDAVRAEHLVHEEVPGNVAAHLVQENGDARAAIAAAPHTLELDLDIQRSASMPMEGRGVYARWDAEDGSLRVYTSTQTSTSVRAAIAAKLDLPLHKVEVVVPDVGGGFGVKIMHPWPEEVLIPWAARLLGREIKWTEDRREHFISSAHERRQLQKVRVGFDDAGRVLGLDVEIWHDNGAYTPYGVIVPIITSTQLLGPYKPGAYRVEFRSLYTNTVMVTPYRGAGRPQGVYAMERTLDAIADYLGKDRAEVREVNFVKPEEMPYDHGLVFQDGRPLVYDSGDFAASLRLLKELVGWDDFESYREQARAQGRRVGIGIACYVEGTGVGPYEGGHVLVEPSGRVMVSTGLTTQGQGHHTVFAQIVADELSVPIEQVHVTTGDTRLFGYAVGTFASRAAVMSGNAIALAAREVRAKALKIAGEALSRDPEDLEIVAGAVRAKDDPDTALDLATVAVLSNPLRYAFDEAAKRATQFAVTDTSKPPVPEGEKPGLEATAYYSPPRSTFANGMHAAIVETDPDTADIKILRYCVVHDCGRMINPRIVAGQIHGGVAQGVAGALYERIVYDENGQLLNASFMDFLMPYATEVPKIEHAHLETSSPLNPLGIKGAGEAGVIPVSALLASAIEDAEGFRITRMPISPSDLWHLRQRFAAGEIEPLHRASRRETA